MPTLMRLAKDRRIWAAILLAALISTAYACGLAEAFNFQTLRTHRTWLTAFAEHHFVAARLGYLLLYAAVVALSLPGAVFLTISAGFLFGPLTGGILSLIGASSGAVVVFLLARTLFDADTIEKFGPRAVWLAANLRRHAWPYLLAMRLVPLFPFFVANVIPAFAHVTLRMFAWTTVIGILPGTTVFSLAGSSLGHILDQGDSISLRSLITPELIATFLGLSLLIVSAIVVQQRLAPRESRS